LRVLFIHQNLPGQFRHLAAHLARDGGNEVVFVTKRRDRGIEGVTRVVYPQPRAVSPQTHNYLHQCEDAILHGQAAARACVALRERGFAPDIVIAHPGWGEGLFVKDVFGNVPLLSYGEFFYRAEGADVGFDPADSPDIDQICKLRARNAHLLMALEAADRTLCPTEWQRSLHPAAFHDRISVAFDGVDTETVRPDPAASIALPDGRRLSAADEVVTYVARTLEPTRGFPTLMRALPLLLALRPRARIVIVGGDGPGYGRAAPGGRSWREVMAEEVPVDPARVHFLGVVPYDDYLRLLQISSVHLYLTVPFVMSWSAVEALAAGCLVVASRTPPVEEFISHGRNGMLVDFFSPRALAETAARALAEPRSFAGMRAAARETVVRNYSLSVCLPRQLAIIEEMTGSPSRPPRAELTRAAGERDLHGRGIAQRGTSRRKVPARRASAG